MCKIFDKHQKLFLPNTNSFLGFSIVFEWGRIFESAENKKKNVNNNHVWIIFLWTFTYYQL